MKQEMDSILSFVEKVVDEIGIKAGHVIPILHAIQKKYNYLPESALRKVCEITEITPASITGVSTFYSQYRHTPIGKHLIRVCTGTACHVKGSELVYDALCRELHIEQGQDTDPDYLFTLQKIACLGCCTIAPVVQIDDVTYGHVKTDGVVHILQDFLRHKTRSAEETRDRKAPSEKVGEIKIGLGSCCVASGSHRVQQALERSLAETGINTQVKRVGCVGMCHRTPLLEVSVPDKDPVLYDSVKPEDVRRILLRHYKPKTLGQRIKNATFQFFENILEDPNANGFTRHPLHIRDPNIQAFLGRQKHIATEHSGQIDPLDLEEYRSKGGFEALEQCLAKSSPGDVLGQIKSSGLRGRGGAGYPSGKKWEIVQQSQDDTKYIICNGDEGDPGAFMDRMIMESYPFRVIEGMIIAAFTIGAHEGYFYIRAEYPLAVHRVKDALRQCQECGLLGKNILGKGYSLNLHILEGAGAFVCGEETALIASLEGKRGNPRYRPPYPAQKGLWGHSTLVSNCETFATVPWIIRNGAETFARMGTDQSKGTKVFSLAGKIARGGLIEVPMGITI
ncbi:MAG: NAD(P)H-dependent oxidoreductase subunit E, partial [Candidatus Aminicenantaceae bacterium]